MAERLRSRRARTLVAALLTISLFASFSIACTGGDTPEVQKPVNETKIDYETFLEQIGVTGAVGVPQPWIVTPANGEQPGLPVDVKGWSALAKDVAEANPNDAAYVRLYVVPARVADEGDYTPATYEVTSATRVASVSPETREWALALDAADFAPGENVVFASTVIGDGTLQSEMTSIRIDVPDGTAPEVRNSGGVIPDDTLHLVCVMATPKGYEFESGDEQKLKDLVEASADYWKVMSHGKALVGSIEWLTNDGKGYPVKAYEDKFGETWEYFQEVLGASGVADAAAKAADGPVSVIVFVPPASDKQAPNWRNFWSGYLGWSYPWQSMSEKGVPAIAGKGLGERRGSFIHMPRWSVGTLLHEIAHGLGNDRRESDLGVETYSLPDLYPNGKDYYGVDEYSNITQETVGNYFLMSKSEGGSTLSGFSQWWLDWAEFRTIGVDAKKQTLTVPTLSTGTSDAIEIPCIEYKEADGRKVRVIMDGRALDQEYAKRPLGKLSAIAPDWMDISGWQGDGVIVYRVKERIGKENESRPGWPRSANYLARLDNSHPSWEDPSKRFRVELKDGKFSSAASENEVVFTPLKDVKKVSNASGTSAGAILQPSLTNTPFIIPSGPASKETTGRPMPQPDLDLHAYLPDGTHIGMNYETGEYEVPVAGAITSGDMAMDDEWILLPPEMASTARFVVSSQDTQAFADALPEAAKSVDLTLDFDVRAAAYSDTEGSVAQGEPEKASIAPGAEQSTKLEGDPLEPALLPLAPGGGGPTGLAAVDPILWELGGAGLLVMIGLLVLLWPRKR
ncbi:MAG: hypothetical protein D9V44_06630 [Actinobacteria bacterium]|nr:MAG: hypothetical protein D9V44_06630 [Actinomycetota bacterium]